MRDSQQRFQGRGFFSSSLVGPAYVSESAETLGRKLLAFRAPTVEAHMKISAGALLFSYYRF